MRAVVSNQLTRKSSGPRVRSWAKRTLLVPATRWRGSGNCVLSSRLHAGIFTAYGGLSYSERSARGGTDPRLRAGSPLCTPARSYRRTAGAVGKPVAPNPRDQTIRPAGVKPAGTTPIWRSPPAETPATATLARRGGVRRRSSPPEMTPPAYQCCPDTMEDANTLRSYLPQRSQREQPRAGVETPGARRVPAAAVPPPEGSFGR